MIDQLNIDPWLKLLSQYFILSISHIGAILVKSLVVQELYYIKL